MDQMIVQRVAFKAVIVNQQNQVLVLREATTYEEGTNTGKYHFPGGRLEPGEKWQQGLLREIREETGYREDDIEIRKPLFVGEWHPVIKGVQNQIIALFIVCKLKSQQEVELSEEHDSFTWLSEGALPTDGELMPPDDEVIESYFTTQ